jgi:damage-control phosphatase, subfamily I
MKIQPECVPCLLKRILFETQQVTQDTKQQTDVIRATCLMFSKQYNPDICSATIATQVHKRVYDLLHDSDPYKKLKQDSTRVALSLVPKVNRLISTSSDPLKTSMLCAILGNVMDFGIEGAHSHPGMLEQVFDRLFDEKLGYDDYSRLKELIKKAKRLVFFTDNCGEIVFDKLLCQELKRFNPDLALTVVVKGEPVLSDATVQDAIDVQFQDVADVLTTGCFAVGVDFQQLPKAVTQALKSADLIVCKGMANYESFSETSYKPVVYLLRIKCQTIARSMGLPLNTSVIKVYE